MVWEVIGVLGDAVTIWDGETYTTNKSKKPHYRAGLTLTMADHDLQVGDKVKLAVIKHDG